MRCYPSPQALPPANPLTPPRPVVQHAGMDERLVLGHEQRIGETAFRGLGRLGDERVARTLGAMLLDVVGRAAEVGAALDWPSLALTVDVAPEASAWLRMRANVHAVPRPEAPEVIFGRALADAGRERSPLLDALQADEPSPRLQRAIDAVRAERTGGEQRG